MEYHKQWLYLAESNLAAVRAMLNTHDIRVGPMLYLTQHSLIKALQSYLAYKKLPPRKTQDLNELLNLCKDLDIDFEQMRDSIIVINNYKKAQYPDSSFVMPDLSEAEWAIKEAEKILKFVESKIW